MRWIRLLTLTMIIMLGIAAVGIISYPMNTHADVKDAKYVVPGASFDLQVDSPEPKPPGDPPIHGG